jgi:uncharacterized protein GlcG (DUF336 family)
MTDIFNKYSVSMALAHRMIEAAERKSEEMGVPSVVAIVDESGVLKAFARMDNATRLGVQTAQDKAFTAAGLGMATHEWFDFIQTVPALAAGAATGIERNVVFGGGFPIDVEGRVVGGIGVVGGTPDQDIEVAQAALEAIGAVGVTGVSGG